MGWTVEGPGQVLAAQATHHGDELEAPEENITPEIADESEEHQLFFIGSAGTGPAGTGSSACPSAWVTTRPIHNPMTNGSSSDRNSRRDDTGRSSGRENRVAL